MPWNEILKKIIHSKNKILDRIIHGKKSSENEKLSQQTRAQQSNSAATGIETQLQGTQISRKQLIIGLDFGTAFTKVIVGDGEVKFAIPFRGRGVSVSNYLIPSIFWIEEDGTCTITDQSGAQVSELKIGLITGDFDESTLFQIVTYLALVFRKIRFYIFNEKKDLYGNYYIDWLINIGLPTDSYHEDKLTSIYHKLVSVAWIVSAIEGPINLEIVKSTFKGYDLNHDENKLDDDVISVFPEFVAQITGYVRSPMRRSDLHMLIDVGAGTLDTTIFNVHEANDEDKFPIFAKSVNPFGTRFLVKYRIKGYKKEETGELAPYAEIPCNSRFANLLGISIADLNQLDLTFKRQISNLLVELLNYTKKLRYPRSQHWQSGIPVFLCGGGAKCEFYHQVILSNNRIGRYPITPIKLPKPENLESPGVGIDDYDRLSVAYGLSFEPFDIGNIVKANDIDDCEDADDQSSGQCPACNGTGGPHAMQSCSRCGGSGFV